MKNNNHSCYPTTNATASKQKVFEGMSEDIIKKVFTQLKDSNGKVGLRHILSQMAEHRRRIAKLAGDSDWALFGSERIRVERDSITRKGPFTVTPLNGQYSQYGRMILSKIMGLLTHVEHSLTHFPATDLHFKQEDCLGRKARYDIKVITEDNAKTFLPEISLANCREISKKCQIPFDEESISPEQYIGQLLINTDYLRIFKEVMPKEYKQYKLMKAIGFIRNDKNQSCRKSEWVLSTQRLEINKKMYALSEYVTWMYRDFTEDPVERMRDSSTINLIHQDPFLIGEMLAEIEVVFRHVITWKPSDMLASLQERVGLLHYLFAHTTPYHRGSAAIGEWLESVLYRYHGYKLNRKAGKSVNLFAFTLEPNQFIQQYPSMITVSKIILESTSQLLSSQK